MRTCRAPNCSYVVFGTDKNTGKGYCRNHQWLRSDLTRKKKSTDGEFKNQYELFDYIWGVREHVSELTGKQLLPKNHPKWHFQFMHVLSKGSYPSYKLRQSNIMLGLPEEHENQETFKKFINKRDSLRREYYKEIYNKKFDG